MAGPGDEIAAGKAGRGHLRASHADREHAIEVLKAAYVQGILAKDELDARLGQALTSRTCASLAAVTADIPAQPPAAGPARPPARVRRRPLARAAAGSGACLVIAAAAVWGGAILDPGNVPGPPGPPGVLSPRLMFVIALYAVLAALGIMAIGINTSLKQRRSRGQLPPRPGPGGHALEGERHGSNGQGPVPPGPHTGQTRTGLRARRPRQHTSLRAGRAPRGTRPAPGTA